MAQTHKMTHKMTVSQYNLKVQLNRKKVTKTSRFCFITWGYFSTLLCIHCLYSSVSINIVIKYSAKPLADPYHTEHHDCVQCSFQKPLLWNAKEILGENNGYKGSNKQNFLQSIS